jgi:hypothetical protein
LKNQACGRSKFCRGILPQRFFDTFQVLARRRPLLVSNNAQLALSSCDRF